MSSLLVFAENVAAISATKGMIQESRFDENDFGGAEVLPRYCRFHISDMFKSDGDALAVPWIRESQVVATQKDFYDDEQNMLASATNLNPNNPGFGQVTQPEINQWLNDHSGTFVAQTSNGVDWKFSVYDAVVTGYFTVQTYFTPGLFTRNGYDPIDGEVSITLDYTTTGATDTSVHEDITGYGGKVVSQDSTAKIIVFTFSRDLAIDIMAESLNATLAIQLLPASYEIDSTLVDEAILHPTTPGELTINQAELLANLTDLRVD